MANIEIYTKGYCPFCKRAKATLKQLGLRFEEFEITHSPALKKEMIRRSQRYTVPQIFINGRHLGGNDDLERAIRDGAIEDYLSANTAPAL